MKGFERLNKPLAKLASALRRFDHICIQDFMVIGRPEYRFGPIAPNNIDLEGPNSEAQFEQADSAAPWTTS
jgi:hypothetical protein